MRLAALILRAECDRLGRLHGRDGRFSSLSGAELLQGLPYAFDVTEGWALSALGLFAGARRLRDRLQGESVPAPAPPSIRETCPRPVQTHKSLGFYAIKRDC